MARTWEEQALKRRDGSLAAKPGTQAARTAEWVRQYREEGLSFGEIARRSPDFPNDSTVRDAVSSWFARNQIQRWRHAA